MHKVLMRRAIALAAEAARAGDEPFGALLVVDGGVRLTARNRVVTEADPTRHAELALVAEAARTLSRPQLERSTLYASTEPCVMCCGAIYWARIPRVVFGCSSQALGRVAGGSLVMGARELFARGRRPVEVVGPVLEAEALEVHHRYWGRSSAPPSR